MTRHTNRLASGAVGLTVIVLVADAIVSLTGGTYLNLGTGVWLALARDAHDGVLYRPLWESGLYGGTRYLPLFFLPIAGLMRLGADAVTAGVVVSMTGLIALAAAVVVLLRRLGVPGWLAALGGALSVAPYFLHQTGFAVRCEPMAVALSLSGIAVLLPMDPRRLGTWRLIAAGALFAAAASTKITTVYGPAAAALALVASGQWRAALKLSAATAIGAAALFVAINAASDGRALESFRACALAGSSAAHLLSTTGLMRTLQLIGTSRLLTATFALTLAGLVIARRRALVPALLLASALAITVVVFGSPGTVITSHIVDAYVTAVVALVAAVASQAHEQRRLRWGALVLTGLVVWAAAQNVVRVWALWHRLDQSATASRELALEARRCGPTMISESPLIPVLGGHRPTILDPFAFHVVALNRPSVAVDLVGRIRAGEFSCVVLEQDPSIPRGRAWYRNVNLTEQAADAVLERYEYVRTIADQRFYRPKAVAR